MWGRIGAVLGNVLMLFLIAYVLLKEERRSRREQRLLNDPVVREERR